MFVVANNQNIVTRPRTTQVDAIEDAESLCRNDWATLKAHGYRLQELRDTPDPMQHIDVAIPIDLYRDLTKRSNAANQSVAEVAGLMLRTASFALNPVESQGVNCEC